MENICDGRAGTLLLLDQIKVPMKYEIHPFSEEELEEIRNQQYGGDFSELVR